MCQGNGDQQQLCIQLSMFPTVFQAHCSSAERPISLEMKVVTIADAPLGQGGGGPIARRSGVFKRAREKLDC